MSSRVLNVFRLYITDQNSVAIPLKWDYTIGLKFEYIENRATDESLETLQEIRNLIKYLTLDKISKDRI